MSTTPEQGWDGRGARIGDQDLPMQLQRDHDPGCEAVDEGGAIDPTLNCHCRDRADIAAAKAAGTILLDLDDLDDLEDALHASRDDDEEEEYQELPVRTWNNTPLRTRKPS